MQIAAAGWSCDCRNICENRVKCRMCVCVCVLRGSAQALETIEKRECKLSSNFFIIIINISRVYWLLMRWMNEWINLEHTEMFRETIFSLAWAECNFFPQLIDRLKTIRQLTRFEKYFVFLVTFRCYVLNGSRSTLCDISMLTFHANFFFHFFITPIFAR